ncbi:MAG: hypothetical protein JKY45_12755 [Emcibacter sp.]|nr:hypothetical protein [Emcibacter sp.]
MLKEISIITIAVTVMGVGTLQARETTNINSNQQLHSIKYEDKISKYDAKKIMKEYLKSHKSYKKLRVGTVKKINDKWKISVTSSNKIPVSTAYVDDKTGKITFKR